MLSYTIVASDIIFRQKRSYLLCDPVKPNNALYVHLAFNQIMDCPGMSRRPSTMLLLGIEFSTECHPVKIERNMPYGRVVRGSNAKQHQDCLRNSVNSDVLSQGCFI